MQLNGLHGGFQRGSQKKLCTISLGENVFPLVLSANFFLIFNYFPNFGASR